MNAKPGTRRGDGGRARPRADQIALLACFLIPVLLSGVTGNLFRCGLCAPLFAGPAGGLARCVVLVFIAIAVSGTLWRLLLFFRYRPWREAADADLPPISIIVPVYNEGAGVARTLRSILESDYPRDRLELIVVDDGSDDDTLEWIRSCAEQFPGRVVVLRSERNCGKRKALALGLVRASGSAIVTVDSDSVVERDALRKLVSPLGRDERIGAVAGRVDVLDGDAGVIGRMLAASFAIAFDFGRSGQSVLGCVLCTPGALSAYRAQAVRRVLHRWTHQKFLGRECRIAEDRALANLLLASGFHTVYQSSARARTAVPGNIRGICRMYLRWARGNIRESACYARAALHRGFRLPTRGATLNFALTVINMFAALPLLLLALAGAVGGVGNAVNLLAWTVLGSGLVMGWYAWRHRTWDVAYGILFVFFWSIFCSWIVPWALLTVRDDSWLTRSASKANPGGSALPRPA